MPRFAVAIFALMGVSAFAQTPAAPDMKLRGGRFKPLTYDQLTPEQKKMADDVMGGERGAMNGPFNVYLRSPETGDLAQALGAHLRYHSALPAQLKEMAILITARFWNAQYEWYAHHRTARQAGLEENVIAGIGSGKRPAGMNAGEEAIYSFCTEMLNAKQVGDATFKAVVDQVGEKGAVDLVGLMGYYTLVSMTLNMDRYPLPAGAVAELKPLR